MGHSLQQVKVVSLVFKYYVYNYDTNKKEVFRFNIFQNSLVQNAVEKEVKKYIRNPKNYSYNFFNGKIIYGFEALCEEIRSIIAWQMRGRVQYEISVTDAFAIELKDVIPELHDFTTIDEVIEFIKKADTYNPKFEKHDCYEQCVDNIEMITRECIYQYKQTIKLNKKRLFGRDNV